MDKIYVELIDGVKCYAPVKARKINNRKYEIVENDIYDFDDINTIWKFYLGDLVICEEREGLLYAIELVSSSLSNRDLYSLCYDIVESNGLLSELFYQRNKNILINLKNSLGFPYKNNPIVSEFLQSLK